MPRTTLALALCAALALVATAGTVSAQDATSGQPSDPTTTTAPLLPPTEVLSPSTTSTTTAPTTTTTPPGEPGGGDISEAPAEEPPPTAAVPPSASPAPAPPPAGLVRALRAQLAAARRDLASSVRTRDDATKAALAYEAALARQRATLEELRRRHGELVGRLERARTGLAAQAVAAYTGDRLDQISLLASSGDINELVRRMEVLGVAIARSRAAVAEYRAARRAAGEAIAASIGDIGRTEAAVAAARSDEAAKAIATAQVQVVVDALAAGSMVAVRGFVFPVAGPRRFSNDFGAPRMTGTALAHSHQGTDIFATYGTPLVAVERGVVTRVGTDRLGGLKLWLVGESGNRYYYAHTSGYAPGLVEGLVVEAGTTLAFVGDSGNAKGTSPHVHFQIHPPSGQPVNPYPLLRAVDTATGGWTAPPSTTAPPA